MAENLNYKIFQTWQEHSSVFVCMSVTLIGDQGHSKLNQYFFSSIFLTNIILFCPQNIQQRIHVKKTSMNTPSNSNIALTSEGQGWQM